MSKKIKVAISIGDLNGVGLEIALNSHETIKELVEPIYMVSESLAKEGARLLNRKLPQDFTCHGKYKNFKIKPGVVSKEAGKVSFKSFKTALELADKKKVDAVLTLPISKEAWNKAKENYKGHTDYIAQRYAKRAIMALGCEAMFVALYTDHIPLKKVARKIEEEKLYDFFMDLAKSTNEERIGVLGFNPHIGENGVLGEEDFAIVKAIKKANKKLNKDLFEGPLVPDTAFTKTKREKYKFYVAMYHDQGLIPLKTLFFDESINVSLNIPIIRASVDHGTAYDIAYKDKNPNCKSYINAVKWIEKIPT